MQPPPKWLEESNLEKRAQLCFRSTSAPIWHDWHEYSRLERKDVLKSRLIRKIDPHHTWYCRYPDHRSEYEGGLPRKDSVKACFDVGSGTYVCSSMYNGVPACLTCIGLLMCHSAFRGFGKKHGIVLGGHEVKWERDTKRLTCALLGEKCFTPGNFLGKIKTKLEHLEKMVLLEAHLKKYGLELCESGKSCEDYHHRDGPDDYFPAHPGFTRGVGVVAVGDNRDCMPHYPIEVGGKNTCYLCAQDKILDIYHREIKNPETGILILGIKLTVKTEERMFFFKDVVYFSWDTGDTEYRFDWNDSDIKRLQDFLMSKCAPR